MAPTPINRKHLIFEDAKSQILKNNTLEKIAASHGITKQILTTWLMSRGEKHRAPRNAVKTDLTTEDALGGNARILFDYLEKKRR